jgi:hypothetical protein
MVQRWGGNEEQVKGNVEKIAAALERVRKETSKRLSTQSLLWFSEMIKLDRCRSSCWFNVDSQLDLDCGNSRIDKCESVKQHTGSFNILAGWNVYWNVFLKYDILWPILSAQNLKFKIGWNAIGNNKCYQTFHGQNMTYKKLNFELKKRQTEIANFRYH